MKNPEELLSACEKIFRAITEGRVKNNEELDRINTLMLGNGYHAAGSLMMSVIHRAGGMDTVMKIISNPEILLIEYNKAALSLKSKGEMVYLFDPELVKKISSFGNELKSK